jgi:hypothetical protein
MCDRLARDVGGFDKYPEERAFICEAIRNGGGPLTLPT